MGSGHARETERYYRKSNLGKNKGKAKVAVAWVEAGRAVDKKWWTLVDSRNCQR